ncbi:BUB1 [Candida oxycetoniae]|uniref:BUB1 n=1 Tax=Candida oxycetoniae TaxID=497107 RepID=A0AAI9T250_9ASCO|nr:BUB1 [Candida oxycetoniae]KAI3406705.2 BUB1 [Candida oxycetoniae]
MESSVRSGSKIEMLEMQKENIQPLDGGRSVSKLAAALNSSQVYRYQKNKVKLLVERDQFEYQIGKSEELDDPLQLFVEYIDWTHNNFPQGDNTESGLVILLERCTSHFRDVFHYKNDPRYLKVWLEYIKHSDSPRDVFVYLAKKEIGNQLALYYEEFAQYLELNGKISDAHQIYQLGIQSNAFPKERLKKSFAKFKERTGTAAAAATAAAADGDISMSSSSSSSSAREIVRNVLALKRGSQVGVNVNNQVAIRKKAKIDVFQDNVEQSQSVLQSIFDDSGNKQHMELGTRRERIKENIIAPATQWQGQIIKQRGAGGRGGRGGGGGGGGMSPPMMDKIQVFRDNPSTSSATMGMDHHISKSVHIDANGMSYTLVQVPGKKTERIMVNMDLLYKEEEDDDNNKEEEVVDEKEGKEEISITELLARNKTKQIKHEPQNEHNSLSPADEENKTITLPLNDDITAKLKDPTITAYSKVAKNEVLNMYNQAMQSHISDDERMDDPTVTNLEGFVTETTIFSSKKQEKAPEEELVPTQVDCSPTLGEDNISGQIGSNQVHLRHQQVINPFCSQVKNSILNIPSIPMKLYSNYYDRSSITVNRMKQFRDITNKQKRINRSSKSAIIDCCGKELYCLIYQLGEGGYGYVYLVETGSSGSLKALKIEKPASKWEYYILHQIHRRLLGTPKIDRSFIHAEALYYFQDESFLVLEYCSQGSLLDLVNNFKSQTCGVDECLCIFITIELLKAIEALHVIGILHGDLKADNCMIRFGPVDDNLWGEKYDRNGASGWCKKGITLIDFGRAVDLTTFPKGTRFISNFPTDEQDCPEMNEGKPWTFEADYYGMGCIIHTLLFGEYIKIKKIGNKLELKQNLKRYWQHELWSRLFTLLLNPYDDDQVILRSPRVSQLKEIRSMFEDWLEQNSQSRNLKATIKSIEHDLEIINRTKIHG